ncbi:MAG: hypothetical protein OXB93_00765 [Cytophagales bacterium]|nr:hypothetical protein [Cytophagales bacterium]
MKSNLFSFVLISLFFVPLEVWSQCEGTPLRETRGGISISDGSGADNYENNLDCQWILSAPDGKVVQVRSLSFDLAEGDSLILYEGPHVSPCRILERYTKKRKPQFPTRTVNSQSLLLRFHTNHAHTAEGWVLRVTHEKGSPLEITTNLGEIKASAEAGNSRFQITASGSWTIETSSSTPWLSLAPSKGSGNATISLNYSQHTGTNTRSVHLNIQNPQGSSICVYLSQTPTSDQDENQDEEDLKEQETEEEEEDEKEKEEEKKEELKEAENVLALSSEKEVFSLVGEQIRINLPTCAGTQHKDTQENYTLFIRDMTGKVIYQALLKSGSHTLLTNPLSGIYGLQIQGPCGRWYRRYLLSSGI